MALTGSRKLRYGVALAVALGAVAWLVVGPLRSNIQYFRTASEAVEQKADDGDRRFRLAGQVVSGSVESTEQGVEFDVTDGAATVRVIHRGDPPQLFDDGVPVVCEGRWSQAGSHFASDRILIRHDNQYRPPDVTEPAGEAGTTS